jgi:hypothetical protein
LVLEPDGTTLDPERESNALYLKYRDPLVLEGADPF